MTQTLKASDVRSNWSQLLNKVFRNQTRVIVEKSGIPIAAVISAEDLARFIQLEEQRKERFKILDRMRDAFKDVPVERLCALTSFIALLTSRSTSSTGTSLNASRILSRILKRSLRCSSN